MDNSGRKIAFSARIIAGFLLLNLLVVIGVARSLSRSFDEVLAHARVSSENISYILSNDVDAVLDRIDIVLLETKDDIEHGIAGEKPHTGTLERLGTRMPKVESLQVADANGRMGHEDLSGQDYFSRLKAKRGIGLQISKPSAGKITFARRLNHPDGSFAGILVARIDRRDLQKRLSGIDVENHGATELLYADGTLLARQGGEIPRISTGQMATAYVPKRGNGEAGIVSSRNLNRYPLAVQTFLAERDYLAGWKTEVLQMLSLVMIIFMVSAGGTGMIIASWHRQHSDNERLAREEEKFHTMADHTQDWEYWQGPDGRILYMTPSCERMTGYSEREFESDPTLLLRLVDPEDRGIFERHSRDSEIKFRIVKKNGEIRWFSHFCMEVRGADGSDRGKRVTNRDITDHHLYEMEINRLAQAVEQNPTGIMITDSAGNLLFTNQAYTLVTGFQFADAYRKSQRELISPEIKEEQYQAIIQHLAAGKPWSGELPDRRRNGESCWVLFTASPIYDNSGNISNYLYLKSDITERKRSEEELTRYKDHLEEEVQLRTSDLILARNAAEAANLAKSNFLANMSHELRTPLNAILGFSNLMRRDPLLAKQHLQNLEIINRSGSHLLTLINDVLEMAKIEAGRVQLANAPFDLGAMLRDVTDMMEIRASEKGLRLLIDQSSRFPRYILGDEARLMQVLINLIGNAVKFTEQGGVTVRLGTRTNKSSHLVMEVEDSGPGISPEDRERLFQPFVQLESKAGPQGTGLGLAISRQFVEMMGGRILLESTPGKGSLFRVDLPLQPVSESEIPPPPELEKGEVAGLAPGQQPRRILIVEDQKENRMLLARLMENIGMDCRMAENGREAVEIFRLWHPHLIWMDRRMPVMDGMQATKIIRSLPGGDTVKIVAVTASAFAEQRAELIASGMDDFVRKPYRFNEIYESLSGMLGVEYVYEGKAGQEETARLTPEMLSAVPEALRMELKDAVESLESERVKSVLARVENPELRKILSRLADNFDYPAILAAMEAD